MGMKMMKRQLCFLSLFNCYVLFDALNSLSQWNGHGQILASPGFVTLCQQVNKFWAPYIFLNKFRHVQMNLDT